MKSVFLAFALTLFAVPAFAAGVTVTLAVGPVSYTTTITAANAARLQTWAAGAYPFLADGVTPNPTPGVSALAAIWQGIIANIQASETATAQKALAAPAPVN